MESCRCLSGFSPDMLLQILGDNYDICSDKHITHTLTHVHYTIYDVSFRFGAQKNVSSTFVACNALELLCHGPKISGDSP